MERALVDVFKGRRHVFPRKPPTSTTPDAASSTAGRAGSKGAATAAGGGNGSKGFQEAASWVAGAVTVGGAKGEGTQKSGVGGAGGEEGEVVEEVEEVEEVEGIGGMVFDISKLQVSELGPTARE